jgi:hypothetical protein
MNQYCYHLFVMTMADPKPAKKKASAVARSGLPVHSLNDMYQNSPSTALILPFSVSALNGLTI